VRAELIGFQQREYPEALPRTRVDLVQRAGQDVAGVRRRAASPGRTTPGLAVSGVPA
jgi:hypothetical protein